VEPIDYRRAIVRRLPLVLALMLIGGGVGELITVHEGKQVQLYQASATVSVPPANSNLSTISVQEASYFAEQGPVYQATAKAIDFPHPQGLHQYITVSTPKKKKKSKTPGGTSVLEVTGAQPSKDAAAKLANAFVQALQDYADEQLVDAHNQQITQTTNQLNQLSGQLESVAEQIAALQKTTKNPPGATTTTTTTTTTPTTKPKKDHTGSTTTSTTQGTTAGSKSHKTHVPAVSNEFTDQACAAISAQGLKCAPSSDFQYETSSVPAALVISTKPAAGSTVNSGSVVNLVISEGEPTTSTTQPTSSTSTTTTTSTTMVPPTTSFGVFTMAYVQAASSGSSSTTAPSSTTTTAPTAKGTLALLQSEQKTLESQYQAAASRLATLKNAPIPKSGLSVVTPAQPKYAKLEKLKSVNPFVHQSVRIGTGVAAGLILGLIIAILLDALDKRLRKANRTAEVFALPVIAEIPKSSRRHPGDTTVPARAQRRGGAKGKGRAGPTFVPEIASPYVALVDEPASLTAEAYRRLRVAVMFTPSTQIAVHRPSGDQDWSVSGNGLYEGTPAFVAARSDGHHREDAGSEPEKRQVVMVVSPGFEPTRSEVVANLAAAYAEAGQRALVVTTTDVRSRNTAAVPWQPRQQAAPQPRVSTGVPVAGPGVGGNETLPSGILGPPPGVAGAPPARGMGEPTEPIAVTQPAAGPLPEARAAVTAEDVIANCIPQQIAGVARLQLGSLLRGPGEMATRGNEVLAAARNVADVVLVEVPALLATPDAEALARACDAVVVVAECFYTRVGPAAHASQILGRIGAPTVGVVLTQVEMRKKDVRKIRQNLAPRPRGPQPPVPARAVS
jgi:Mrp family chromosome partitioning ATPase/capsular polysaccharide biosynthesis protein